MGERKTEKPTLSNRKVSETSDDSCRINDDNEADNDSSFCKVMSES